MPRDISFSLVIFTNSLDCASIFRAKLPEKRSKSNIIYITSALVVVLGNNA